MSERIMRMGLPLIGFACGPAGWEAVVQIGDIPAYLLPGPVLIARTLVADGPLLLASLWVTLITAFQGFLLAAAWGTLLAILFNQSRLIEYSFYPYAVILQVTPILPLPPLL